MRDLCGGTAGRSGENPQGSGTVHVLITAGPTHEYLDDVRYLSNLSSGKMGFECAKAAARAGHRVTLVTGPVALPDPRGVRTLRVTSALEMLRVASRAWRSCDALIATAAVSDHRPKKRFTGKVKKGGIATLELVENPDILKSLAAKKGRRRVVGFALEVQNARENALKKYQRKNLDYIVLNGPSSFGADRMNAMIYGGGGKIREFRHAAKSRVATGLIGLLSAE